MNEPAEYPVEGSCACGKVRYRVQSKPLFVHCCHCRCCQRESGSAFALNAMIEADRFELTAGEVEVITVPTESGKGQKVSRCPTCKISLWSNYAGPGDLINFLRVGTLFNPDLMPPDIHIYTASKQPWIQLPEGTPASEEYYKTKDFWPQESIERVKALRKPE